MVVILSAVRAHVVVSGRVQGVFFRSYTQERAYQWGLTGWVKNRGDGKVEAVFEGDEDKVKEMVEWCRKGPPGAHVTDLKVEWEEAKGEFTSFHIKYGY